MTREFIGRREELKVLEKSYGAPTSGFVSIYGRRRVGKSELILQFLKDKPGIYYLGKKAPAGIQIREFLQEAASALGEPLLASVSSQDWKSAIDLVCTHWKKPQKLILVFDEFQWMVSASPELPSVIQEFWDRKWSLQGSILLILCGSLVGFMEREVLGRKSPLFGRRTAQIALKPFHYLEAAEFHPRYSVMDRALTYFLCGGVPLYLRFFSEERSVEMNIVENFLNEYAPLSHEPDFLLREELREVESYYAILLAVTSGDSTNRTISERTGIGNRALYYYLQQLVDLGYLSRRYPLTGQKESQRRVRYVLEDPVLRFWFRFVYPNNTFIAKRDGLVAFKERIRPNLESYWGSCFERLCREAMPFIYRREGVHAAFEIGEYWDKTTQIDVVGYRDDGWTDLGECKWGPVRSAKAVEDELEKKVVHYPNLRNANVGRRIFVRDRPRGRDASEAHVRWHSLEDLCSGHK